MMTPYKNLSGNSGVKSYLIKRYSIIISFTDGNTYEYSFETAGRHNIAQMKSLAERGLGLATYINKYVRDKYEKKTE
jgi:hypothetical protein